MPKVVVIKKMPLKQGTETLVHIIKLDFVLEIKKMPLKQGTETTKSNKTSSFLIDKKDAPKAGDGNIKPLIESVKRIFV